MIRRMILQASKKRPEVAEPLPGQQGQRPRTQRCFTEIHSIQKFHPIHLIGGLQHGFHVFPETVGNRTSSQLTFTHKKSFFRGVGLSHQPELLLTIINHIFSVYSQLI